MSKKKERIAYVDPQSMINLAKYDYYLLRDIDMDIHYFCSKQYDFEVNPRISYRKVFSYNKMEHNWQKAISYVWSWMLILVFILRLQPKVVHIQWFRIPRFDYFIVCILRYIFKIKVVYTAHNILPHQGNEHASAKTFRKAYHAFDRVIVHSQTTKDELVTLFNIDARKVKVIRHGILPFNISDETYKKCAEEYDKKYASLKGKTIFTSLGFQNYYKGTDLLAKAWTSTPSLCQNSDCMLLIIGKVNDTSMDLSMLKGIKNVIFDNRRVSDEEFVYLLRHTDVYVLPYREISQSGAMLTILTEHVPMLLTDVGALAEPLSIARIGWKLRDANEQDIKESLLRLVDNKEEILAIKNDSQAWEKVCLFYDWKHISEQTQQLYESLF